MLAASTLTKPALMLFSNRVIASTPLRRTHAVTTPTAHPEHVISPLRLSDSEIRSYGVLRGTEAARTGSWGGAGFEREVTLELARRAGAQTPDQHTLLVPAQVLNRRDLTVASPGAGGYLAGDAPVLGVLDALREQSLVFRAGAQALTGLRASSTFARQTGKATVTWQSTEATQASETSTYSLGSMSVSPKTVSAYIEESHLLRKMAPDLAEAMIRRDLRFTLARAVDAAAINGSGTLG